LQVFALEPYLDPRPFREGTAGQEGCPADVRGDPEGCRPDVIDGGEELGKGMDI
jgi:hypothetical protein